MSAEALDRTARDGTRLRLSPRRRLTWAAHLWKAVTRQHHRELLPLLAPHVPRDGIVFDIGAHAGQFTKLFAGLAPAGHVFAFEPGAYPRSLLAPMLKARGLRNVTLVPFGLSDTDGAAVLSTPIKASGSLGFGVAHLGQAHDGRAAAEETVPLMTFDGFAARHALPRLDFVKLDVEGWEGAVLRGAARSLMRFRPALLIELVERHLARAGDAAAGVFADLVARGYRAARLEGDPASPRAVPHADFAGDGDYLFIHEERAL